MEYATQTDKAHAKHGGVGEDMTPIRVGVMGTANIARKNCWASKEVPGLEMAAIASRSLDKAQAFAEEFGMDTAFGSYDELLESDVDAVYIPLPTSMHLEWVVKAAKAGKHVLCEKPCGQDASELLEMLEACAQHGVLFMDAVMFMHHPRLGALREAIEEGKLGPLGPTTVSSSFSFLGDEEFFTSNIRAKPELDALGVLGDLGWYNVRLALFAFGWELPAVASATTHRELNGVPMEMSCTLRWAPEETKQENVLPVVRTTTFHCSFLHASQQWAVVTGTEGLLMFNDFCIPRSNDVTFFRTETDINSTTDKDGSRTTSKESVFKVEACRQEAAMQASFRNCVNATKGGAYIRFWPGVSLATQLCMDALLASARANGAEQPVDAAGLMKRFAALHTGDETLSAVAANLSKA